MSVTDKDVVGGILELLDEDPRRWIQGQYAKTADGKIVRSNNPDAAQFCSIGFINRYSADTNQARRIKRRLLTQVRKLFTPSKDSWNRRYNSIPSFNDSTETNIKHVRKAFREVFESL